MYKEVYDVIQQSMKVYEETYNVKCLWRDPLLAFLSAKDERLAGLKQAVSPTHLSPQDILAGAESVAVFYVPFTERVVESNVGAGLCSRLWAEAYVRTNDLIARVSDGAAALLARHGAKAATVPATHNFDEALLVSDWSHSHIAVLAGLGSFGLNNMLITDAGCCGRLGTVVTDMPGLAPAAPAPVKERCPYKIDGSCGLCVKRCEAGAWSLIPEQTSFGRDRCYRRCLQNAARYKDLGLADVCGKCLCGLPCSMKPPIPRS